MSGAPNPAPDPAGTQARADAPQLSHTSRRPTRCVFFPAGMAEPLVFHTSFDLARHVQLKAAPWPLSFSATAFTYEGFDTLPGASVYAGGHWLGAAYLPGHTDPGQARDALAEACGVALPEAGEGRAA